MQKLTDHKHLLFGIVACTIAALFYCYEFVLRIVPGALQGELIREFGNISAAAFGELASLYYIAYAPMQMPVGMLMDKFGPRKLLSLACLCCTLGAFMFNDFHSLTIAGVGRFLIGFGSSFAFVGVLSLAIHWLPRQYFAFVTGLVTTLSMVGVIYGQIKVTQLAASFGLLNTLELIVALGAVITVLMFFVVRDGPKGFVLKKHSTREFFNEVWQVITSPQVWIIGVVGACLYTSLSVFGELWGKTYLEHAHHLTKIEAAESISAVFLGWAIGAPLAGFWSDKTKRRLQPLMVSAVVSLMCILFILYYPGLSRFNLNALLLIYGIAGGAEIIVFIMAKEATGTAISSTVFAAVNMIVSLVGAVFQPLVGILLDTFGSPTWINGEPIYHTADYQIALSVLPISLVVVILCGFFLKRRD